MSRRDLPVPQFSIVDLIDQRSWWKNRGLLLLNLALFTPLITSIANGLDSSLVNGLQILPEWGQYFQEPKGAILGLITSSQFIGNLLGLPFSPFLSDNFGRRAALFLGSLLMLAGVAVQSMASNVGMLIGSRVIVGFGLAFCHNAAPLLLIELAYPTHRGKITAMYNSFWYIGSILSAWACFGAFEYAAGTHWSWRVPTILQAVFPLIQVFSVWFIPESPRWLVSRGRESKAARILAKYHANGGDERDPLVVFEMAQIRHALRMENKLNNATSYWSLFSTVGNRKRMRLIMGIAIFSQWSGNGLVSYYIDPILEGVGITDTRTKTLINGGLQIFNFVVAIASTMLIDYLGRRTLFLISNSGMLISFIGWTISAGLYVSHKDDPGFSTAAKASVPLIFLFYFFYDLAYTPLLVAYSLEILPFKIRAKGFAVMNFTIMAAIAFNLFVNPVALDKIGWKYYLVYCGWLVVEMLFVFRFVIETKGRTLEETAALFDGDQDTRDLVAAGGHAVSSVVQSRHIEEEEEPYPMMRRKIQVEVTVDRPSSADLFYAHTEKRQSDISRESAAEWRRDRSFPA